MTTQTLAYMLARTGGGQAIVILLYLGVFILYLGFLILFLGGMWKTFNKANQPGWGVLIPIYNVIVMLRVAGKPLWWLVLLLIPIINIIPAFLLPIAIARNFGKGVGFGIGLIFLPFVFYPILGFGQAQYRPRLGRQELEIV